MNFLEHATGDRHQLWKYPLVFLCAILLFPAIGSIPMIVVSLVGGISLSNNLQLALMLFTTFVALLLTLLMVKVLHRRSFQQVINGTLTVRSRRILTGAGVWFVLMALAYVLDFLLFRYDYVVQFNPSRFIPLVLITLALMPFQTTGEEFLFRGYLAQGIAAWTRNRWLALLIPSLCFGLMHGFNPEVKEFGFWVMMPQYIYFGLFFGFVSILDDGIELAVGMHAANNIFLSLFVTHRASALQTDAVFQLISINPYKDALVLLVLSLVAGHYFSKKYGWDFRIFQKKIYTRP